MRPSNSLVSDSTEHKIIDDCFLPFQCILCTEYYTLEHFYSPNTNIVSSFGGKLSTNRRPNVRLSIFLLTLLFGMWSFDNEFINSVKVLANICKLNPL